MECKYFKFSNFVLFFSKRLFLGGYFFIPHTLKIINLIIFTSKSNGVLIGSAMNKKRKMLKLLRVSSHEHGIYLPLFRLLKFFLAVWFHFQCIAFTYFDFLKILECFMFFAGILNSFYKIKFLLIYGNTIGCWMFTSYLAALLNLLISSNSFFFCRLVKIIYIQEHITCK